MLTNDTGYKVILAECKRLYCKHDGLVRASIKNNITMCYHRLHSSQMVET